MKINKFCLLGLLAAMLALSITACGVTQEVKKGDLIQTHSWTRIKTTNVLFWEWSEIERGEGTEVPWYPSYNLRIWKSEIIFSITTSQHGDVKVSGSRDESAEKLWRRLKDGKYYELFFDRNGQLIAASELPPPKSTK